MKDIGWTLRIFRFFLNNLMAFYVFWGLLNMLGFKSFEGGMVKVVTVICFLYSSSYKFRTIDICILLYIVYSLFSYGWGNVPWEVYANGIVAQLMPISFYFIVRLPQFRTCTLLKDMRWPLLFAFVSALYLYFYNPSWYIAFKTRNWDYQYTGVQFYEYSRLSGFWPWPYFIGYAALFYLMWELKEVVFRHSNRRRIDLYFSCLISVCVLFFAQLRVTIVFAVIYLLIILLYAYYEKRISLGTLLIIILGVITFVVIIAVNLFQYLDTGLMQYIFDRSLDSKSNIVYNRFGMFSKYTNNISFMGEGLGSFSHYARSFHMHTISDNEYIRIPNEIGMIGFAFLLIILLSILVMGIRRFKLCFYETNIIFFLLIAMMGAAPLEHLPLHPYMYWFCMGRIVNVYIMTSRSKLSKQLLIHHFSVRSSRK